MDKHSYVITILPSCKNHARSGL